MLRGRAKSIDEQIEEIDNHFVMVIFKIILLYILLAYGIWYVMHSIVV